MKEKLKEFIELSQRIVFFGGAGVSTESGIPDFRSQNGLYNQKYKYSPETILSHSFFLNETEEFYRFYREKMIFTDAKPNPAHFACAELEKRRKLSAVVTQNIDGLHYDAGSRLVYELHGSVRRNICMRCRKKYGLEAVTQSIGVPHCSCGGIIKPDVVLYEEPLDDKTVSGAVNSIARADMLIVAGTSLTVWPASGLVRYFSGSHLVLINRDETSLDSQAELVIRDPVGEVMNECVMKTACK